MISPIKNPALPGFLLGGESVSDGAELSSLDRFECRNQALHLSLSQFPCLTTLELRGQRQGPVTDAHQTTDDNADSIEHATNFPIAPFSDGDVVPAIGTLPPCLFNVGEAGWAIFQIDTIVELFHGFLVEVAKNTDGVFPIQPVTGMHQPVGQVTAVRRYQQTTGVDVQSAHGDPATAADFGQIVENGRTAFRIVPGHDFAFGLVIQHHTGQTGTAHLEVNQFAVNPNLVGRSNALTDVGRHAIYADAAGNDPLFQFAAGAMAGISQGLVQLGGFAFFIIEGTTSITATKLLWLGPALNRLAATGANRTITLATTCSSIGLAVRRAWSARGLCTRTRIARAAVIRVGRAITVYFTARGFAFSTWLTTRLLRPRAPLGTATTALSLALPLPLSLRTRRAWSTGRTARTGISCSVTFSTGYLGVLVFTTLAGGAFR